MNTLAIWYAAMKAKLTFAAIYLILSFAWLLGTAGAGVKWLVSECGCLVLLAALALAVGCSLARILPAHSEASRIDATKGPTHTVTTVEWYPPTAPAAPAVPATPGSPAAPVAPQPAVKLTQDHTEAEAHSTTAAGAASSPGAEGAAVEQVKPTPPLVVVPTPDKPTTATGGTAETKANSTSGGKGMTLVMILVAIGALGVLAGGVMAIGLKMILPGAGAGIGGAIVIGLGVTADKFPWIFGVAGLIGLAGIVVYLLWVSHRAQAVATAANSIVTAVEAYKQTVADPSALQTALAISGTPATEKVVTGILANQATQAAVPSVAKRLERALAASDPAVPAGAPAPAAAAAASTPSAAGGTA